MEAGKVTSKLRNLVVCRNINTSCSCASLQTRRFSHPDVGKLLHEALWLNDPEQQYRQNSETTNLEGTAFLIQVCALNKIQ